MTQHERKDFMNLLARGRGLAPVYDLEEDDAEVIAAMAAEPVDYDEHEQDERIDARARDVFRARE